MHRWNGTKQALISVSIGIQETHQGKENSHYLASLQTSLNLKNKFIIPFDLAAKLLRLVNWCSSFPVELVSSRTDDNSASAGKDICLRLLFDLFYLGSSTSSE